jgi:uncharacterized protein
MTYLLDVNVLIALAWPTHVHHGAAQTWFRRTGQRAWATCPLTQTAFVRISSNPKFIDGAVAPNQAVALLAEVTNRTRHEFWPDDLSLVETDTIAWPYVVGHRQVTDVYLLALAKTHGGKLATLDGGVAALLPDANEQQTLLEHISA